MSNVYSKCYGDSAKVAGVLNKAEIEYYGSVEKFLSLIMDSAEITNVINDSGDNGNISPLIEIEFTLGSLNFKIIFDSITEFIKIYRIYDSFRASEEDNFEINIDSKSENKINSLILNAFVAFIYDSNIMLKIHKFQKLKCKLDNIISLCKFPKPLIK